VSELMPLIRKLELIASSINEIVREEAINLEEFIADLNREQLMEGKKGDGSDMPNYAPNSKQPSSPGLITLFDTGDFHESIKPVFEDEGIDLVGLDFKTPFLVAKFGNILDLDSERREKLKERLLFRVKIRLKELL